MSRLRAPALATASGLLLFAAGEPLGWAPLGWVALVPLFSLVLTERRRRRAFLWGAWSGAVFFGLHLSWIFLFGWMAWTGLVLLMAAYFGTAALVGNVGRRLPLAPVLVAGAWVGAELLRDRWPFGGFPWGTLGTSQAAMPGVRWLAGSVGAYGLTFLLAFAAAVVAERIVRGSWAWGSLALVGAGLALFAGVDAVRYAPDGSGRPLRVALVQGDVPRPVRPDQRLEILRSHVRLTQELAPGQVDLVVWPEDAIGIGAPEEALAVLGELARQIDTPILSGRSQVDLDSRTFVNAMELVDASGAPAGTYVKRHPVPFGEYVPLTFLRRYVSTLDQVPFDLARGEAPAVFEVDGATIAAPICFESVFPRDVREFAGEGAELYVFATNDASFGRSPASSQHLAHARMRSLELRQWSAQAALSGITAVVAPDGSVSHRTGLFERDLVVAEMRARPAASLYARVGDLFAYGWAAGTAFALLLYASVVGWGRRRTEDPPDPALDPRPLPEPEPGLR